MSSSSRSSSRKRATHIKCRHGGQSPIIASLLGKSLCVALLVAIADWLALEGFFAETGRQLIRTPFTHVEAAIWPKARICFNSMTTSFQSGCVYCDMRSYASTITSCTGQPILANNITQAQAFCIATACLQQTGKQPTVLGRKRRSLLRLGMNGNKGKPVYLGPNGNVTAQFANSLNGTTSGNLAFVLNRPAQALWLNPLSRVLTRNSNPNKNLQWQFGKTSTSPGGGAAAVQPGAASATSTGAAAKPPAPAKPAAPPAAAPKPAAPAAPAPSKPAAAAPAAGR